MNAVFGAAGAANVGILQGVSSALQQAQRRVASGVEIFGAADDSARYELSSRLLARSHQLDRANQNIALSIKTLEGTDLTLRTMIGLVDTALDVAARAQSRGTDFIQGTRSTTDINEATIVSALAVAGSRLSIVVDGGQSFTYTFGASAATTRWGDIVNALNSANIGLVAEYIPATAPSTTNLRFRSLNGKDFRFGGDSDRNVIASLGAVTSGTGGTLNLANQFVIGAAAPAAANTGFTISYGGAVQTAVNVTASTVIGAGSSLSFTGGDGSIHTWSATGASSVANAISSINGMNAGVIAELVNSGAGTTALRLRNGEGGDIEILAGAGDFVGPAGTVRFGSTASIHQIGLAAEGKADHTMRLIYGTQYDSVLADLDRLARNNPGPLGVNLLDGSSIAVTTGETGSAIVVRGSNVATTGTLGLTQVGQTWTSVGNITTSVRQATAARATLVELAGRLGINQRFLRGRLDINASFSTNLRGLGNDLVGADVAEESARITALQVRQQFAAQAFAAGTENRNSLLALAGLGQS